MFIDVIVGQPYTYILAHTARNFAIAANSHGTRRIGWLYWSKLHLALDRLLMA